MRGFVTGWCRIVAVVGVCGAVLAGSLFSPAVADEAALARLDRSLAAIEAKHGKTSPYLIPVIEQLAEAHLFDGALGEARALRRRALDIAIAAFGCDSASAAEAMVSLAVLDIERGRYLDAEPLLVVAQAALKGRLDPDHPVKARIFTGLARIAAARGEPSRAEKWARRAVAIARVNPRPRSAAPLRALGDALSGLQRFPEAEQVLKKALAQDRAQHGADGFDTARSLSRLANLYLRWGRPEDALPLIEEAAAVDQARLGPTHPFIADDFYDLGLAYDALHRPQAAVRAFTEAIELLERGAGRDTPRVAYAETELSRLYRQQGEAEAADAAFRDARRILNKAEAEEHRRERRV